MPNEIQTVGGYYREMPLFTFLTVPKAGHFVPNTALEVTKEFLSDYFKDQRLICKDKNETLKCSVESY